MSKCKFTRGKSPLPGGYHCYHGSPDRQGYWCCTCGDGVKQVVKEPARVKVPQQAQSSF